MDNLLLLLMIVMWVMYLPLSEDSQRDELNEQLLPSVVPQSNGKVKVNLFPSRTTKSEGESIRRFWSASLKPKDDLDPHKDLVDSLEVKEGLSVNSPLGEAITAFQNVTKIRIASHVPLVVGFLEGYLSGDLVRTHVANVKAKLSILYGTENLEKLQQSLTHIFEEMSSFAPDVSEFSHFRCVIDMLEGLYRGCNRVLPANKHITLEDILLVNIVDDLPSMLEEKGIKPKLPTSQKLQETVFYRYFGSTVGLKISGEATHVGHLSWSPWGETLVDKKYFVNMERLKCGSNWFKNLEAEELIGEYEDEDDKDGIDLDDQSSKRSYPRDKTSVSNFVGSPGAISPLFSVNYRADIETIILHTPVAMINPNITESGSTNYTLPSFARRFYTNLFFKEQADWESLANSTSGDYCISKQLSKDDGFQDLTQTTIIRYDRAWTKRKIQSIMQYETNRCGQITPQKDITTQVTEKGFWISTPLPDLIAEGLCGHSKCRDNTFSSKIKEVEDVGGLLELLEESLESEIPLDVLKVLLRTTWNATVLPVKNGLSLPHTVAY
eukprot:TRINITY_DN3824_c0_g1_i1.p1 TRINITY_DN3824_c0_g1~~TRINITY_DN3824_c0_g1_i1.p1  ORF type:complete len:561 (-),score=87.02 TRINITY_DN3824_c0_g1_i1:52-1707(-)